MAKRGMDEKDERNGNWESLVIHSFNGTGVACIKLNRPSFYNALDQVLFREIPLAISALDSEPAVRVILLAGEGPHFCSGIDLSSLFQIVGNGNEENPDQARAREQLRRSILYLQSSISAIEECRKPVIAMVHGACIGAGVDLITACDLRYCSQDAIFCVKEVDMGITADLGTLQRLPRIIGEASAMELALTCRKVEGLEAKDLRLVNDCFQDKEHMYEKVRSLAEEIAQKSPVAVAGTKAVILKSRDLSVSQGLDYVATWNSAMLVGDDLKEALEARKQKRKPLFSNL